MAPQFNHVIFMFNGTWVGLVNALEHLGNISKVISVMRFRWRWLEFRANLLVSLDGCTDNCILQSFDSFREIELALVAKNVLHHVSKDVLK